MTAADIASALGGAYRSGTWWRCRCPVHDSSRASLALRESARELIAYCHAGCSRADVIAELRRRGLLEANVGNTAEPPPAFAAKRPCRVTEATDRQRRIGLARDMWQSGLDAGRTVVERYLRSRGIEIRIPPSIRIIGMHTPYGRHAPTGDRRPVMVAAVEHVEHGFVGVSRTWLAMDGGGKSTLDPPRLFTGPVAGGAVRLGELRLDLPLIIAEGVESGLAASELLGWPAWAALSARGVAQLVLPTKARDIVIAADRDRNGVGEAAARQSAMRWAHERRRVRIIIPHRLGADANDLLCEAGRGD
jgi:hypothetical protein